MQKDADAKAVAVPPKDAKPVAKKPRLDCIDGCRFALVFPIVVAHFARFEPQRCHKLPSVVKDGQRQRPGIVIYYILHHIYIYITLDYDITFISIHTVPCSSREQRFRGDKMRWGSAPAIWRLWSFWPRRMSWLVASSWSQDMSPPTRRQNLEL